MKKNLIIIALCVIGLISCNKKNDFKVNLNLQNAEGKTAILQKNVNSKTVNIDTVVIQNNNAQFVVPIDDPAIFYSVKVDGQRYPISFFSENKDMTISGDINKFEDIQRKGCSAQDILNQYNTKIKEYDLKFRELYAQMKDADERIDTVLMAQLEEMYNKLDEEKEAFNHDFIMENKDNFVSHFVLYRTHWSYELEDLEDFVKNFKADVKSEFLNMTNDYIAVLQRVAVGQPYLDFTMETPEGNVMALSELVGKSKLLLVDFWASWCGPCRGENPNVVAVYNEFHDKGFDVFGVSLDQNKENWIKAIADDNLTWNHVSDLKYWNNEAAKMYGISSIPSNLLLDGSGIIVAKNLRGEDLRAKVEEILGK